MRFTMDIESYGQQTEDDPHGLTRDLLRKVASAVDTGHVSGTLKDVNGNTVGSWKLEAEA